MSADYSRDTELRNVQSNDLYQLAVILDEDDYWKKLMEAIPKDINNQTFSVASDIPSDCLGATAMNGRKYTNDHIRLIQNAFKRPGESRLCPQILFDEWGSSGRKNERPTLGVLLHLLLKAHLFRAADYVAEILLKESKPSRPTEGPGAEITCDLPSSIFADIRDMADDSENYPDTELLQRNANFASTLLDNNKDYYTKYRDPFDKHLTSFLANDNDGAPKPPPRLHRSARLLMKQQQQNRTQEAETLQQTANIINQHDIFTINEPEQAQQPLTNEHSTLTTSDNLPKISLLMNSTNSESKSQSDLALNYDDSTPKLSFLIGNSITISQASEDLNSSSTPNIVYSNNVTPDRLIDDEKQDSDDLPVISALNLNGERDKNTENLSCTGENVPSVALHFDANSISRNTETHFNVPYVVESIAIETNLHHQQVGTGVDCSAINENNIDGVEDDDDDVDYDDDDVDIDDDADIPNLSIFNDSSLTSVTNTSGDNSFEQSINDSRPSSSSAERDASSINVLQ